MLGNELTTRAPAEIETEADAYEFLERLRWGNDGPTECPHCGSEKGAWYLKPKDPGGRKSKGGSSARSQRRVWKCRENSCRRQFSVLTNTVLHATKMPVRAWVGVVVDLCRDDAGVSARDIASRWDVTEKSAWAMLTRIQDALTDPEVAGAALATNAPLWFELEGTQREHIEQDRVQQNQAAMEAFETRIRAEEDAVKQAERNIGQTLFEADLVSGAGGAEDNDHGQTALRDGRSPSLSSSDAAGSSTIPVVITSADEGASEADSSAGSASDAPPSRPGSPAEEVRGEPISQPAQRSKSGSVEASADVPDQVKSGVEGALTEASGAPALSTNWSISAPSMALETGREARSFGVREPADEGRDSSSSRGGEASIERRKPSADRAGSASQRRRDAHDASGQSSSTTRSNGDEIPVDTPHETTGADAPTPRAVTPDRRESSRKQGQQSSPPPRQSSDDGMLGVANSGQRAKRKLSTSVRKKARRKQRRAAESAAQNSAEVSTAHRPEPVDNLPARLPKGSDIAPLDDGHNAAFPTRAQRRRDQRQQPAVGERSNAAAVTPELDALGGGWLGRSEPSRDDTRAAGHAVSTNQGQSVGIDALGLGPAWIAPPDDVSDTTHSSGTASANQWGLFVDEDETTEDQ